MAMKPRRKQVRCEFNLYPLYEENDVKPYMIKIILVNCGWRIEVKEICAVVK